MIQELFNQALSLHQAGQLAAAQGLYERLNREVGPHADILHLYGTLLFQSGQPKAGQRAIRQALVLRPDASSFYDHLGSAQRALNDLSAARGAFDRAFRLNPRSETASQNGAIVHEELGDLHAASLRALRSLLIQPSSVTETLRLGSLRRKTGAFDRARNLLEKARIQAPQNIDLYFQLRETFVALKQQAEADKAAKRGLVIAPDRQEFYVNFRGGDISGISGWDGTVPKRLATILRPDAPKAWDQLAAEYYGRIEYKRAANAAMHAIVLAPELALPYNSAGTSLHHDGRFRDAVKASQRALLIDPRFSDTEYNLCFAAFCSGQFEVAWAHWDGRLTMTKSPGRVAMPERWSLTAARPAHLLVASEQGVGDDILFLSCLPDLLDHADRITVEADSRLHGMLGRSFPEIGLIDKQLRAAPDGKTVYDYRDVLHEHGFTHSVFSGDLPAMFRADPKRDMSRRGYLRADDGERGYWKEWLESLGSGPFLGLCWRSGTYVTKQRTTGYLLPEELIAEIPGSALTVINLQYGDAGDELERIRRNTGVTVHDPPGLDQTKELDRVLALMSCLDLIATPATTVQALAGASGIPTIGLDKSNFCCMDGWDPMFSNLFPIKHPGEPTLVDGKAAKFGKALRHFVDHGSLPIRKP